MSESSYCEPKPTYRVIEKWSYYRISGVPSNWDKQTLLKKLATATPLPLNVKPDELELYPNLTDYNVNMQTAIMCLEDLPECLEKLETKTYTSILILDLDPGAVYRRDLRIDVQFDYITPLNVPRTDQKIVADVIAVHGIFEGPYETWLDRGSNVMWLRDLLPESFPNVRILGYGYKTGFTTRDLTCYGMLDYCRSMLETLNSHRRSDEVFKSAIMTVSREGTRPIIFIGHDFGALMVLHVTATPREQYIKYIHLEANSKARIATSTKALLFFGVPYIGLASTEHLEKAVEFLPLEYQERGEEIIRDLKRNSDDLVISMTKFHNLKDEYKLRYALFSYYENEPTRTKLRNPHTGVWEMATEVILVDPWSSEIRIYGEVAISMVRNHSTMVKFKSAGDSEYLKVVTRIAECLELIKKLKIEEEIQVSKLQNEQRDAVLEWLYPGSFQERHEAICNRRGKNTCDWILETPQFQEWIQYYGPRLLWGNGVAGVGKTFIMSRVIDYFISEEASAAQARRVWQNRWTSVEPAAGRHGMAYYYFVFEDRDKLDLADLLGSLIRQLVLQMKDMPLDIENLQSTLGYGYRKRRPTVDELYQILKTVSKLLGRTFILCDALDECDPETLREDLLPLFYQMKDDGINVFLTCRDYQVDIQDLPKDAVKIELMTPRKDIVDYIEGRIARSAHARRIIETAGIEKKNLVVSRLAECVQGRFILLDIYVKQLLGQTSFSSMLAKLEEFEKLEASSPPAPRHPDNDPFRVMYDREMKRLQALPTPYLDLALRTLLWLANVCRTLTVQELRIAVSIKPKQTTFDLASCPDIRTILEACGSFVSMDSSGDIYLAHYTVKEYLKRYKILEILGDPNLYIATACMTYLSFDTFSEGPGNSAPYSLEIRYPSHHFLGYAASNLGSHLKECDDELSTEPVLDFLQSSLGASPRLSLFMQVACNDHCHDPGVTPLDVAAYLGKCSVVKKLLDGSGVTSAACKRSTPLHFAILGGSLSTTMVDLLLEKGFEISTLDRMQKEPVLLWAVRNKELPAVQLLLSKGAKIPDGVLHAAVDVDLPMLQLLLTNGADVSAVNKSGDTALHLAAEEGRGGMVDELLRKGASISTVDSNGRTALHLAAKQGHYEVVIELLTKGADISAIDSDGCTALHLAAGKGYENVVDELLKGGANI